MPHSDYIEDCLSRRVIFFTGKGGVGKTTLSWATALLCHKAGARVRVASWSPFDTAQKPAISGSPGIEWIGIETLSAFREYVLQSIKFESLYHVVFDNKVLKTFVRAAPGLPETVAAGKIWDLYQKKEQDLLIVDLPSSGHAVSFFQSPLGVQKIFSFGFVHQEAEKIVDMFRSPSTRLDLVALPEELPLVEAVQLKSKLESVLPLHFGYLHLNQCTPRFRVPAAATLASLGEAYQNCVRRHEERVEQEAEVLSASTELGLPAINIPRFPTATLQETLAETARFLEDA